LANIANIRLSTPNVGSPCDRLFVRLGQGQTELSQPDQHARVTRHADTLPSGRLRSIFER
jgi:hypothetical protein